MIKNKVELECYLLADKFALGKTYKRPKFNDDIWKFQIYLRKIEYYMNQKGFFKFICCSYYKYRKYRLGVLLGFDIPAGVFGPGLRINHFGNIVVNSSARVGFFCDIHQGVNIGSNNTLKGEDKVPTIGNNVWIGPGAKLFGSISIGNGVAIGANAVVNKSFEENVTIAGLPARKIKTVGTESSAISANEANTKKFLSFYPQYTSIFKTI